MGSAFTWLDHSDRERRKVLEAIDRFKETEARDELGLGPIRDGFADHFFPGTSVIMTRARYFFFVPWMYMALERKGAATDAAVKARRAELALIEPLGDAPGNLGRVAGNTLKRLPSSVYWIGLRAWGMRLFGGSQTDYHQLLERGVQVPKNAARDDDGELVDGRVVRTWVASLPREPASFPKEASFDLTRKEAQYLRERIRFISPQPLLARLFDSELPDVPYPWLHPALATFPDDMRAALHHAQCFAEVMHGAALLYNHMLAVKGKRDSIDAYRQRIEDWRDELAARGSQLAEWKLPEFWQRARAVANVTDPTMQFVNNWIELRLWEQRDPTGNAAAQALVAHRERRLKGGRARLENPRALELWNGASGTERLVYRWHVARRLLTDIVQGLRAKETADA